MRCALLLLLAGLCFAQEPSLDDVIRKLGDDDYDRRELASQILTARGESARPALTQVAQASPDAEIRRRATDLLAEFDRRAERRAIDLKLADLKYLTTPDFDPKTVKPLVEKSGTIAVKETWSAQNSYHITADLSLAKGAELTIEPGTVILVGAGVNIRLGTRAKLIAKGAADRPIVFTALAEKDGKEGYWGKLIGTGASATLAHVQIRRGQGVCLETDGFRRGPGGRAGGPRGGPGDGRRGGPGGGGPGAVALSLTSVGIFHTQGDALRLTGSVRGVNGLVIRAATGVGLTLENTSPLVRDATVSACRVGVCIGKNCAGAMREVRIAAVKEEGIQVQGGSSPRIERCLIRGAGTGLSASDSASPQVTGLTIGTVRGDGIRIDGNSSPTLTDIEVAGADGIALVVRGASTPTVGRFLASDCKKGFQSVAPGCLLQEFTPETGNLR